MNFVIRNIKWLMLVSGLFTCTMFYGVVAPQAALESMFGESFSGTLESIIVRSWCALVGIIGAILIYGALHDKYRVFCIVVAMVSKAVFVSLVLIYGQEFLIRAGPALALDAVTIAFGIIFLVALSNKQSIA